MYDIAIIGGGPAGAMLARLIGGQYRVLLVDKRPLDAPPDFGKAGKCCGGLLAPDAQQVLAELGLGVPHAVLSGPQLFMVRTIDVEQELERYYQRFYLNCHRELFDRWLISLAPSSVDARFGSTLKRIATDDDGVTLELSTRGRRYIERAKLLVGADGAHSLVRKLVFPDQPQPNAYIAIQEWYESDTVMPYFSAIFDRSITDFYSWTIPKDNLLIVGSALLPHMDPCGKFALLRDRLAYLGFCLGRCVKREGAMLLRPDSLRSLLPGNGRVALLGEAAGWISPSSAEGISYAFRSAMAFAGSLAEGLDIAIARYRQHTTALRRNILLKQVKSPFMYTRLLRGLLLRTGLQSLDIRAG